ncbi:MAG: sugar phosphate nucleotidyltransferase [Candidatus Amulumruptor caecigallinarius]|nr:sugar phosphate nucleotidyltransferase [Candidatus Amulumruptor caecigallinarius]
MNAMIMAAGLGTRLKPWTDEHPKALFPIGEVPMIERVISKLADAGVDRIVVNVHHFADQLEDFLLSRQFGVEIVVSDERRCLLETGGAIAKAAPFICEDAVIVHNADILSDVSFKEIMRAHEKSGADVTLVTSGRESTRKLVFDEAGFLLGWHHTVQEIYRPGNFSKSADMHEHAFSGIYVLGKHAVEDIVRFQRAIEKPKFPIMDYLLSFPDSVKIREHYIENLTLIDIGKPENIPAAEKFAASGL